MEGETSQEGWGEKTSKVSRRDRRGEEDLAEGARRERKY